MTEAVKAVIKFGFNDLNLNRIDVCHLKKTFPQKV